MPPAYLALVADAPSPSAWPGAPRPARVGAAQLRLALALALARTPLRVAPDLWGEVAAHVRGVRSGVNGVLEVAGLARYKAPVVVLLRPRERPDGPPSPSRQRAPKWRRVGPGGRRVAGAWALADAAAAAFADGRAFGALGKHEQVARLRGYLADCATRRGFALLCAEAGMGEGEFTRLLRVADA